LQALRVLNLLSEKVYVSGLTALWPEITRIPNIPLEKLNERSVPLLQANDAIYRELLGFYRHAPQGVKESFQRLERTVASLTAGVEAASSGETYISLPQFPQPQPMTPQVEMMA
jgi:hypothetical protein